jgi:hypothetical protein
MARVFKHTYTKKDGNGQPVKRQTKKWYIEYRDANRELQARAGLSRQEGDPATRRRT